MTETEKRRKLTNKVIFSYAGGDLFGGGAFYIIGILLIWFLTTVVGLSGTLAGTVVLIGKIWDAITDPTMGYISDNTRSKHGRRRIYFLIGIIPIFLSWVLLWTNWGLESQAGKFIYYLLAYMFFNTVFTLVMVPYNAMPSELASGYKERSKLMTIRMAFSQGGMLLGALLYDPLLKLGSSDTQGYLIMAVVFGLIYAIPWIFVFKGTFEKNQDLPQKQNLKAKEVAKKITSDYGSTFKNKSLRRHLGMYITAYVSMDIFMALMIYFVSDYLFAGQELNGQMTILLGVVAITQLISLLVVFREVKNRGNSKTYRLHASVWIAGLLLLLALSFIFDSIPFYSVLAVGVVVGFGLSGCVLTPYNMLAFVADADELITTERREGIYAGMMTFLRKIAQAVALWFVGIGIDLIGYIEHEADEIVVQSLQTQEGIKYMIVIAPLVLLIIGIITSLGFKITPKNHEILMTEINRLKQGGLKLDVSKETKTVCEEITGLPYETLYKKPEKVS